MHSIGMKLSSAKQQTSKTKDTFHISLKHKLELFLLGDFCGIHSCSEGFLELLTILVNADQTAIGGESWLHHAARSRTDIQDDATGLGQQCQQVGEEELWLFCCVDGSAIHLA